MTRPQFTIDSDDGLGILIHGATIQLSLRAAGALLRELNAMTLNESSGLLLLRDALRSMRDTFDGKEAP
jgi:hypothetical protein